MNLFIKTFEQYNHLKDHDPHLDINLDNVDKFNLLMNKLGVKIENQIGKGSYGVSFETTDNRIVKFTTDEWEALTINQLVGDNNTHLCDYYLVKEIDDTWGVYAQSMTDYYDFEMEDDDIESLRLFIIIMEKIDPITDKIIKKLISKIGLTLKFNTNYEEYLDIDLYDMEKLNFYKIPQTKENYEKMIWVVEGFKNIFKELGNYNIEQVDINVGNLGLKKGNLCLYDISGRGFFNNDIQKLKP